MFEISNDLLHSAFSVSALAVGAAYCVSAFNGTSARSYHETVQALDAIEEFAELRDGWAGPGSLAPSRAIRDMAKAAILTPKFLSPMPDISAMPNGTIAFDWEADAGSANLEIGVDNFSFYLDLEGSFFPLSGSSRMLPVLEIADIIFACFNSAPIIQPTRPTSYSERSSVAVPVYA
ncbi:hypothetical protein [Pseudomonas fluorescens]|uniref:hypothetical protein n=1 Tax=Pseudomonas fluorescens TaxID=294 RepID=UPI0011B279DD|nr:hypothetical protein [Pseudomonas fluorescens]